MRVLPFAIVAAVVLVVQVSLVPAISVTSASIEPQLLLIVAMFVALYARAEAAMLACWTLGLLVDLATVGPMGAFAFSFGLVGVLIVAVRASLFRSHPLSHFFLAFAAALLSQLLVSARQIVDLGLDVRTLLAGPFAVALYTALLAPYLMLALNRLRRTFRFPERI